MTKQFLAALFVLAVVTSSAPATAQFSGDDIDRLEAGKIVTRKKTQQRGTLKLTGGQSWQVVNRNPRQTWTALNRLKKHHNIVPGASRSRTLADDGKQQRVELTHGSGRIRVSYDLNVTREPQQRTMLFRLVPTDKSSVRAGWGFVKVRAWGGGRSLVSFGALVDIGDGLLTGVIRPALQRWLLTLPTDVKRYVESAVKPVT